MVEDALDIAVIVGSTREGRFAPVVARWFLAEAGQRADMRFDLLDLADLDLPSRYTNAPHPAVADLRRRIEAADGFVVITPEYNHGYPASLKHAIDLADREWRAKPVAFVSYGGRSGGIRAVEQLRQVFAELHAVTVRDSVSFHNVWEGFDRSGGPVDAAGCSAAAKVLLDELAWWASALRDARRSRPYAA
jgi:NAD(P)H-dependent FMN reductase